MSDGLNDILDDLDALAGAEDDVTVADVVAKLGARGQGVLLMIPGLVGVTPIGAIPVVPTLSGVVLAILAGQILIGREQLWLPGPLGPRAVEEERLRASVERLRRPARWIDRHFGESWRALTGRGERSRPSSASSSPFCCRRWSWCPSPRSSPSARWHCWGSG